MGIQPGARFPAWSADAFTATLSGHFVQAINRNWPVDIGGFGALEWCCYDEDSPGVAVGIFLTNVIDNL
jgi:hypothetical protein